MDQDRRDWAQLGDDERHFLMHVLAFFAARDGIVVENLALWSHARNKWFVKNVLTGVDLRAVFLAQDPARVKAGLAALRAKRGRLPVRAKDRKGLLEEFVGLMASDSGIEALVRWSDRVEGITATVV